MKGCNNEFNSWKSFFLFRLHFGFWEPVLTVTGKLPNGKIILKSVFSLCSIGSSGWHQGGLMVTSIHPNPICLGWILFDPSVGDKIYHSISGIQGFKKQWIDAFDRKSMMKWYCFDFGSGISEIYWRQYTKPTFPADGLGYPKKTTYSCRKRRNSVDSHQKNQST